LEEVEFDIDRVEMDLDVEVFGEDIEGWMTWTASEDTEVDGSEWESEPEFDEGSSSSGTVELDEVGVQSELVGSNMRGKSFACFFCVSNYDG